MQQWQNEAMNMIFGLAVQGVPERMDNKDPAPPPDNPVSPPQTADPELSIVDHLVKLWIYFKSSRLDGRY